MNFSNHQVNLTQENLLLPFPVIYGYVTMMVLFSLLMTLVNRYLVMFMFFLCLYMFVLHMCALGLIQTMDQSMLVYTSVIAVVAFLHIVYMITRTCLLRNVQRTDEGIHVEPV